MSEEPDDEESYETVVDRERGALTRGDRELLLGTAEYDTEQQRRNARYRLRKHIRNALIDLTLVAGRLDNDELKKVQKDMIEKHRLPRPEYGLFELGFRSAFVRYSDPDEFASAYPELPSDESFEMRDQKELFEGNVRGAFLRANKTSKLDPLSEINVDFTIERTEFDEDELIEKLVHGSPTHAEFSAYLTYGDIDRLRESLRKNNEVIKVPLGSDPEYTFGPDDETLIRRSSEGEN